MGNDREALKRELFAALASDSGSYSTPDGRIMSHHEIRELLQEWIPTGVFVKRRCDRTPSVVVAAPHVSFDNWTEYYANRVAHDLNCGEVLAKNFRDEDGGQIPVSIGRHIHVNRPTESKRRGEAEGVTPRAQAVFLQYREALAEAGGQQPLDLLIELHGHRRNLRLEVATVGINQNVAAELKDAYQNLATGNAALPHLYIEPLDKLRFSARRAKQNGSLTSGVCRAGLHIEIPRFCRENETARRSFRPILSTWLLACIETQATRT